MSHSHAQQLKTLIQDKQHQILSRLHAKHPQTLKQLHSRNIIPGKLRKFAAQALATTAMATALMTHPALAADTSSQKLIKKIKHVINQPDTLTQTPVLDSHTLASSTRPLVADSKGQLSNADLWYLNQLTQPNLGFRVAAELDGYHLNHQYGWIGFEQHLLRYPGDNITKHDEMQTAGIAPATGAWGYFANSKSELTPKDIEREKYYVAVQTLYIPEWNHSQPHIKDWYQYRKVIVINPDNGTAVIANIADAGPAKWTGKQFGGSPEVMQHLDLHQGPRKGQVILLFVDDPNDEVPLGPINFPSDQLAQAT